MGDGAAKGPGLRPRHVNMDPLVVAGGLGKLVDPLLRDHHPVTQRHFLTHQGRELSEGLKDFHDATLATPTARACRAGDKTGRSCVKPSANGLPLGQVFFYPLRCQIKESQATGGQMHIVLRVPQVGQHWKTQG